MLHRCSHGLSHTDVRLLNNTWAQHVTRSARHRLPKGFQKGMPVHISIDNSDGKQQTLTGIHTTHHTNGTVFQIQNAHLIESLPETSQDGLDVVIDEEEGDYGTYKLTKKVSPAPNTNFSHEKKDDLINWALHRDIAWVLTSAVGHHFQEEEQDPIGSWTNFMKKVTSSTTKKCFLDYLEVIPIPPGDNVCKWYLDTILKMIDDLGSNCVFLHSDETVYSKIMMIKWAAEGKCDKIIALLRGISYAHCQTQNFI